jgi:hypothetical protein
MSWWASVCLMAQQGEWMMESEGDLAEKLNSVERMWEQICKVLCSRPVSVDNRPVSVENRPVSVDNRPVSVDNRTKQTVDRAMSLQNWMYKCRVIPCELFLKFLWVFCFNCLNCIVNKCCYLLNPPPVTTYYNSMKYRDIWICPNFKYWMPEHRFLYLSNDITTDVSATDKYDNSKRARHLNLQAHKTCTKDCKQVKISGKILVTSSRKSSLYL